MRRYLLMLTMFSVMLAGAIQADSLEELSRPFMRSLPHRVYIFSIQPGPGLEYTRPPVKHDGTPMYALAVHDTLNTDSTAYLLAEEYARDGRQALYCILADATPDISPASSLVKAPTGDTVSLWSNDKPIAEAARDRVILSKLMARYRDYIGDYSEDRDERSLERLKLYASAGLSTALVAVAVPLLMADDTKKQNGGGICLGLGLLGYIDSIVQYVRAKPKWEKLGEMENRLRNWSPADTDSLLSDISPK